MKSVQLALAALLVVAVPAFAQHPGGHPGGGGHPQAPAHGPAEFHGTPRAPEQNHNFSDKPGHPNAPHVDNGRTWVGHDNGRGHVWRLGGGKARSSSPRSVSEHNAWHIRQYRHSLLRGKLQNRSNAGDAWPHSPPASAADRGRALRARHEILAIPTWSGRQP